jgi:hypothetical protein
MAAVELSGRDLETIDAALAEQSRAYVEDIAARRAAGVASPRSPGLGVLTATIAALSRVESLRARLSEVEAA